MMGDEVDEDIERVAERIAREEAAAELVDNDLERWRKEREAQAEDELRQMEERLKFRQTASPEQEQKPESESRQVPAEATDKPIREPLERFESLEVPADADAQSSPE